MEKINSLRARHEQLTTSIDRYEARIAKQTTQLDRMNRRDTHEEEDEPYDDPDDGEVQTLPEQVPITAEDIEREEEELRELEKKKRGLLDRVSSMERDLGGLLR
jgi:predicted  nucleic acid-binding Zn-ribbon protein